MKSRDNITQNSVNRNKFDKRNVWHVLKATQYWRNQRFKYMFMDWKNQYC